MLSMLEIRPCEDFVAMLDEEHCIARIDRLKLNLTLRATLEKLQHTWRYLSRGNSHIREGLRLDWIGVYRANAYIVQGLEKLKNLA